MTSFRFEVRNQIPDTTTRPNGDLARRKLHAELSQVDEVVVDLEGIILTPSFADEFLGVLLAELGEQKFRQAIHIENVSATSRSLLRAVLGRRAAKPAPPLPPRSYASA